MRKHPLADKASLSGIRRAIRADLNRVGMDPSLTFDCLVAVTEACTNALTHGHSGYQEEPWPFVHWEVGGSEARFFVKDYSTRQWSRTSHPSRDIEYLEAEDRVGGFGLELMRKLMDEVDISMGPEGTTVCLIKRFSA